MNFMNDIMVSICCLAYNQEKYIRQCLDGFVMQKCNFKYEVLIHDDASTDHTADIIREYEHNYPNIIKPIYQNENQYSKHIQISLKYQYPRIQGKYIAFCEGDDFWTDPYKLQKQVDIMDTHPECCICLHRVSSLVENGVGDDKRTYPNFKLRTGVIKGRKLIYYACCGEYVFQTSCYFIRKDIILQYIHEYPKFVQVSATGDTPLLLYAGHVGNAYYIDEIMSCYRRGSSSSLERTRSLRESEDKMMKHYMHQIEMMQEYDKYTSGKYHRLCQRKIDSYWFDHYSRLKDYKSMCQIRYWKFLRLYSIKACLKIFLCAYFPNIMNYYDSHKKNE